MCVLLCKLLSIFWRIPAQGIFLPVDFFYAYLADSLTSNAYIAYICSYIPDLKSTYKVYNMYVHIYIYIYLKTSLAGNCKDWVIKMRFSHATRSGSQSDTVRKKTLGDNFKIPAFVIYEIFCSTDKSKVDDNFVAFLFDKISQIALDLSKQNQYIWWKLWFKKYILTQTHRKHVNAPIFF